MVCMSDCKLLFVFLSINQAYFVSTDNYYGKIFRCNSGEYTYARNFCDGDWDCIDNSDESRSNGCYQVSYSGRGKFRCQSGTYKHINVKCDTIKDCDDGSDELNCGDEVNVGNCSLSDGKFLCHDGKRCLELDYTCDGHCNCFDCSDENNNCTKEHGLQEKCPRGYLHTPNGPLCVCNASSGEFQLLCDEIKNCSRLLCEQQCHRFRSKEICSCNEGYHSVSGSDGNECRSNDWYEQIILYSTLTRIKSLNLTTNQTSTLVNGVNCTALAAAHDYVYYATSQQDYKSSKNFIFKARMVSENVQGEKLIESDSAVTSIAIDYITNNVYFTANESLFVCSNDGRTCTLLRCCGVSNVALAPMSGWIFYTRKAYIWSQFDEIYYIMRSNMDGFNETIIADDFFRTTRIPMAVNEKAKRILYVVNSYKGSIKSSEIEFEYLTFDGKDSKEVMRLYRDVHSVTVIDRMLFLITENDADGSIYNARKFVEYGADLKLYFRDNSSHILKYLYAHNALLQRSIENPCAVASCPGLCLLHPVSSVNINLTYTCSLKNIVRANDALLQTKPSASTENSKAEESFQSKDSPQCRSFFASFILLLVIATVLGFLSYFALQKRHLYPYYNSLRGWKWSRYDERVEMVEQME